MEDKTSERTSVRRISDEQIYEMFLDYKEHKEHEVHDREQLIDCMNDQKRAMEELTELVYDSNKSTKGLVEAWNAAMGAVKVTAFFGKTIKMVLVIGIPFYAIYEFLKHIGK